jgi:hypothetical protein
MAPVTESREGTAPMPGQGMQVAAAVAKGWQQQQQSMTKELHLEEHCTCSAANQSWIIVPHVQQQ